MLGAEFVKIKIILAAHFLYIGGPCIFFLGVFIERIRRLIFAIFGIYYAYILSDSSWLKDGKPWPRISQLDIWAFARKYHNFTFFLESDWQSSKAPTQAVMAFHPHGVVTDYRVMVEGVFADLFPTLKTWRTLAASVLFRMPFMRELALWTACVSADRQTAEFNAAKGHSIVLCPGGMDEQLLTQRGKERVFIKNRKGFVRLAIKFGIPVSPVYVFGTNDMFYTPSLFMAARKWILKTFRICPIVFFGRYFLVAGPGTLYMVVGNPIRVIKQEEPNKDYVEEVHNKYIEELKRIFFKYRDCCGAEGRDLEII